MPDPLTPSPEALIERLEAIDEGRMYDEPATTHAICQEAASLLHIQSDRIASLGAIIAEVRVKAAVCIQTGCEQPSLWQRLIDEIDEALAPATDDNGLLVSGIPAVSEDQGE